MLKKNKYGIIVCGAGPAGSSAAKAAAEAGADVLLIEKKQETGTPLRCGEASGSKDEISRFIKIDHKWISAEINAVRVKSDNAEFQKEIPSAGLVLDRKIFDRELALSAVKSGADFLPCACLTGVKMSGKGQIKSAEVLHFGEKISINADIFIGADGPCSTLAKAAGLKTKHKKKEFASGLQYLAAPVENLREDCLHFFITSKKGYFWAFPKGGKVFNIGTGWIPDYPEQSVMKNELDSFMRKNFPKASVVEIHAGGIPGDGGLKEIVRGNLAVIGDAAHHIHPLSGGGIMNALEDGLWAGKAAAEASKDPKNAERHLKEYEKAFASKNKKSFRWGRRFRNVLYSMSGKEIDTVISGAEKMLESFDRKKIMSPEFLKLILKSSPLFLRKAGALFGFKK
ncbi:MAG: NAD(P)/FAD-dependent oxidoreductase [Fibrobacterota bacterium]